MNFKEGDAFTETYTVSEAVYYGFIDIFKDENPLHTQNEFAIKKGFKAKVMHGNILNGFLSHFVGECLSTKEVIIHSQEIQFKKPVYLHDELMFKANVSGVFESVHAIEFKFNFTNSSKEIVAKGKLQIGILK